MQSMHPDKNKTNQLLTTGQSNLLKAALNDPAVKQSYVGFTIQGHLMH